MNIKQHISKIVILLAAILFAGLAVPQAHAGPAPRAFGPIAPQQMAALKPGTQVAVFCGNCHAVSIRTVGKDFEPGRSIICTHCRKEFRPLSVAGGKATVLETVYVDVESGKHKMYIAAAR